ncbi:MAG: DNA repair protein RadC [Chloroflexota bacterium]|nr:DNA repair protein RadC [Dehalococcoidia bacterium]MDW8253372.1 DNA repair protein RadC [Chloroflexota bacterium]
MGDRSRYLLIRDLPTSERPRERLLHYGPAALSNAELIAIIWRTGTARESVLDLASRTLSQFGSLAALGRASIAELTALRGVGEAKAVELQAAIELGRRTIALAPEERLTIRSPADIANLCIPDMALLDRETLRVILLNMKNHVLFVQDLYRGSLNRSVVRVAEVFREAIRQNAAAIVVVHNHPSGDPSPSSEDLAVTRELVAAGRLLEIEVLDHLIIAGQRYVSLKERGLGFPPEERR